MITHTTISLMGSTATDELPVAVSFWGHRTVAVSNCSASLETITNLFQNGAPQGKYTIHRLYERADALIAEKYGLLAFIPRLLIALSDRWHNRTELVAQIRAFDQDACALAVINQNFGQKFTSLEEAAPLLNEKRREFGLYDEAPLHEIFAAADTDTALRIAFPTEAEGKSYRELLQAFEAEEVALGIYPEASNLINFRILNLRMYQEAERTIDTCTEAGIDVPKEGNLLERQERAIMAVNDKCRALGLPGGFGIGSLEAALQRIQKKAQITWANYVKAFADNGHTLFCPPGRNAIDGVESIERQITGLGVEGETIIERVVNYLQKRQELTWAAFINALQIEELNEKKAEDAKAWMQENQGRLAKITELKISAKTLYEIPSEIYLLTGLKHLELQGLSARAQLNLSTFTELEHLDLSSSRSISIHRTPQQSVKTCRLNGGHADFNVSTIFETFPNVKELHVSANQLPVEGLNRLQLPESLETINVDGVITHLKEVEG